MLNNKMLNITTKILVKYPSKKIQRIKHLQTKYLFIINENVFIDIRRERKYELFVVVL